MGEIMFGDNKDLYGVVEKSDGRIEIRVYHENGDIRQIIAANLANPSHFESWASFRDSNPRAKYHLASIVKRWRSHFRNNKVDFVMR
ncbi:MAG: hypothetical protein HZB53_11170 [Chloroflexi bacterium]|nr:hypothetical protein [Chloroflexota bacterium]